MPDLLPSAEPPATPPPTPPATPPAEPPATPPATPPVAAPPKPPDQVLAPDANKEWLKTLPEDLRENPSLGRYSSTDALARAYLNAEKMIGAEKVPIPKDPNDQEGWDRYYKAGGRPDEPTQYQFAQPKPEELPQGVTWDTDMEGWWRGVAFRAGLSQKQAAGMVDEWKNRTVAGLDANNKASVQAENTTKMVLQRDWGSQYEAKRQLANAAFSTMSENLQTALINAGMKGNPEFSKWLADQRSKVVGELEPRPPGDPALTSPDAARDAIANFRERNKVALADAAHPEHARLTAELTKMYAQAFPEPAPA